MTKSVFRSLSNNNYASNKIIDLYLMLIKERNDKIKIYHQLPFRQFSSKMYRLGWRKDPKTLKIVLKKIYWKVFYFS